jgi:hypothetical protein
MKICGKVKDAGENGGRMASHISRVGVRHLPVIAHKLGDSSPMSYPCQLIKRNLTPSSRHPFHYLLVLLYEVILQTKYLYKPSCHAMRMHCASLNNASQTGGRTDGRVARQDRTDRQTARQTDRTDRTDGRREGRRKTRGDGRGGGGRGGAWWLQRIKERP